MATVKFCDICGLSQEAKYHEQWKHQIPITDPTFHTYWKDKEVCEGCSKKIATFIHQLTKDHGHRS